VKEAMEKLQTSADDVRRAGFDIRILTGGGSGTLPIDLELGVLNELQPGSYVFMDASYIQIGWDADGNPPPFRSALTVLTTVTSRPADDRAVVDAGWKSVSCDSGPPIVKDRPDLTFEFAGDEHGIVRDRSAGPLDLRLGETLELIPSHCDTTVNLHDRYVVLREGRIEDTWDVATRGLSF
jgi:3-hydroxy-D-aspartate aldolase